MPADQTVCQWLPAALSMEGRPRNQPTAPNQRNRRSVTGSTNLNTPRNRQSAAETPFLDQTEELKRRDISEPS